ncbi:FadR/GntR family transcriptional regulator [Nocardioides dongkuii]|uniref:FadR/GntR family transcriptional regulator n=1 Tax=Nocardioides dongkuii TaxID=2760089 RepID=UPI0015F9AB58|nr:FCD domain-containing protein [Nocardioides dongkuii]
MRAYKHVVERVEEQILAGTLKVGDRLPPERDLAAQLQVSRAAVREAMRTLEAQGVVRSGVGSGPDAGTVVSALPSEALTRLLRLHVALANFAMDDVVAARVMLERSSAALAAAHASPAALAAVAEPLQAMAAEPDRHEFNDLDTAFHIAVAEAGGNRLVADMTIAIREAMRLPILRELEQLGDRWPAVRSRLYAEHRAIHDAIAAGDETRAGDLMAEHIHSSRRLLAP